LQEYFQRPLRKVKPIYAGPIRQIRETNSPLDWYSSWNHSNVRRKQAFWKRYWERLGTPHHRTAW